MGSDYLIQSGNVIFKCTKTDRRQLTDIVEKQIKNYFGFDVPVIIKTKEELKRIIEINPFPEQTISLYLTLLSDEVEPYTEIQHYLPDQSILEKDVVYIVCPNGYGNTKLNNTFFEKKFKVKATTRNWKTMNEILKLAKNLIFKH